MNILINATAARESGALTILKDFFGYISNLNDKIYNYHLITTTKSVFKSKNNVFIHEIPAQTWKTRIMWDRKGFQQWCKTNGIIPDVVISFQNTCPKLTGEYKTTKILVYYHQQLPLVKYRWKVLHKDERKLFLYAHFYGFFVNRWNRNAEYVVQLPYIKQLFCNKFSNIDLERVHVIRPNLPKINIDIIERKKIDETKKIFLYPAIPVRYKNHKVILDAMEILINQDYEVAEKIEILFTVQKDCSIAKEVISRNLEKNVKCIGKIPYEELLTYYKRCDCLLFPSEIETFGLPLIEAAMFGKPIIASDLPFTKEVLVDYEGHSFVNPNNPIEWKDKIKELINSEKTYSPLKGNCKNTWEEFMEVINSFFI